jgi:hypothetical protein
VRTELVHGLKAHVTSPATRMSFTFTAQPEPLMPDAAAPVSLGVPLGERGELRPHDRNRAAKRPYPLHPSGIAAAVDPRKTLASGSGGGRDPRSRLRE